MMKPRIYEMSFANIYSLYIAKVERKGKSKEEVDTIIFWLCGYDEISLQGQIDKRVSMETFFDEAPHMNERASLIKGVVCGVRVEAIEDPVMQKIRYLDKLIDELAKGKRMEQILR